MVQKKNLKKSKKPLKSNKFIRFTSTGLQMGVTIWLGNEIGKWLDLKYNKDFYESLITLASIFISIYFVISQVLTLSKDD